jgi:YHS domain-containing protein
MGLALGKDIKTDCSVNTEYEGKTYCFGNEQAKDLFLKNPDEFVLKAQVYHSSRAQAPAATPDASKAP